MTVIPEPITIPLKQLFTPQEVAALFEVTLKTIYLWCANEELYGAIRIGGVWRIPRIVIMNKFNERR